MDKMLHRYHSCQVKAVDVKKNEKELNSEDDNGHLLGLKFDVMIRIFF